MEGGLVHIGAMLRTFPLAGECAIGLHDFQLGEPIVET